MEISGQVSKGEFIPGKKEREETIKSVRKERRSECGKKNKRKAMKDKMEVKKVKLKEKKEMSAK